MKLLSKTLLLAVFINFSSSLHANDSLMVKTITMELARDIADESIKACRKLGYQVSAVVVDRNGLIQVALRDARSRKRKLTALYSLARIQASFVSRAVISAPS